MKLVLSAHCRIPQARPGEIERTELLARLTLARDSKLIMLAAGSGFGKSTVLAQYARLHLSHTTFASVVWLTLRACEDDPDAFLNSLTQAIADQLPHWSSNAGWWPSRTEVSARQRAAALSQQLNQLDAHLLLVLDGAHALGSSTRECLEVLLLGLAEGHQVCLSLYETASFPAVASLVARGEAVVVPETLLAFSEGETAACLDAHGRSADPEMQAHLEGWPIAVGLVGAGLTADLHPAQLIEHALERLPEALITTLEGLALHEFWSEDAAAALDLGAPPHWLRQVREAGVPISPVGGAHFRPHRLLSEVLVRALRRSPQRFQAAARAAALRAQASGAPLAALRLFRDAGDQPQALDLAVELTARSQLQYDYQLTRQVLEEFAPEALPPALLERLGTALYQLGQHAEGLALLSALEVEQLLPLDRRGPLVDHLIRSGHLDDAWTLAASLLAQVTDDPSDDATWTQLAFYKADLLYAQARYAELNALMTEVLPRAERAADPLLLGVCLGKLAISLLGLGRYDDALPTLEREISVTDIQQRPLRSLGARLNLVLLRRGQLDQALVQIERAAQIAEAGRHPRWPDTLKVQSIILHHRGDTTGALRLIEQVFAAPDAGLLTLPMRTELWLAAQEYALALGDTEAQQQAHHQIEALLLELPLPRFAHLEHLHPQQRAFQARAAFLAQRASGRAWSAPHLARARVAFGAAALARASDMTKALLAVFLAELERLEQGAVSAPTVAALHSRVEALGGDQLLRLYQRDLPELFALADQNRWWSSAPGVQTTPAPDYLLDLSTLGALHVRLGGQTVRLPFARCGELLVWLALHGPASRAQLFDALWDGSAEPSKAEYTRVILRQTRLALSTAAHLSFSSVIYAAGCYQLHPALTLQADVQRLQAARFQTDVSELRRALASYGGPFLPGAHSEWAAQTRLEAQDSALVVALRLGASLETADPPGALQAYHRAVELEPLCDLGYAGLTRLYTAQGDDAGLELVRRLRQLQGTT